MKSIFKFIFLFILLVSAPFLQSCEEEDEADELDIQFQTDVDLISADGTFASGSAIKIGIEAETEKAKDPIIRFTISKSVNGGENVTVYTEDLSDLMYEYDFPYTITEESGSVILFTFTITNRDGLIAQKTLTITVS